MATFKFGRYIDIHWNGYDIQGPADTVFSIPDQLYEEFDADIAPVEPTLQWIDTNEFQTLSNSVSASTLSATFPVALATTTSGKTISLSSSTNPNGYVMIADGSGGVIFSPASTSSLTSVVGISPISTTISGGTVSVSIDTTALNVTDAVTATTLRTYVKNSSGSTITKGQAVYVSSADGTNALIDIASASNEATSSKTLGILASTLTNNAFGYVIENGQLSNIDTSAATAGDSVWLGNTPGSLVFGAPPAEPSNSVYLGVVTKANASTGEILVKVQNGYEIDELHDVSAGTPTDLDILQYKSSSGLWTKSGLTAAGIVTPTGTQTLTNKTLTLPSINNTTGNYTTSVSTASTTTVLTSSSTYYQYVTGTGSTTYRIQLPNTSTLTLGQAYEIHNNSSNQLNVLTSLGTSLLALSASHSYRFTCIDTSTNSTSAWDTEFVGNTTTSGSGSSIVLASSPTISSPTLQNTITISSANIRLSPTTISTTGGSTALQNTTNYYIRTTGTTTHRLNLSSVPTVGNSYIIKNDSTGDVTVNSSNGDVVATLKQGQGIFLICLTTSGTTAADWAPHFLGGSSVTGTGSSVRSASPTLTGDVTLNAQGDIRFADSDSSNWVALQGAATIPSNVTWTLPSVDGASGQFLSTNGSGTLSWAAGGISYSSFTASGTYTVPSGINWVYVYAVGGGAGGQGGGENTQAVGGLGGAVATRWFRAIDLASSTYSIVVGGGGQSAAGNSTTTLTANNAGGNTTFGTNLLVAAGGPSVGTTSGTAARPGAILVSGDTTETVRADGRAVRAGTTPNALFGPASGGGCTNGNQPGAAGGSGFGKYAYTDASAGGTAGTAGSASTNGGNGGDATGYGDGGGAGGSTNSTSNTGGNGGAGSFPGGGGGGGGSTGTSSTVNGGSGGAGASGWCMVIAG